MAIAQPELTMLKDITGDAPLSPALSSCSTREPDSPTSADSLQLLNLESDDPEEHEGRVTHPGAPSAARCLLAVAAICGIIAALVGIWCVVIMFVLSAWSLVLYLIWAPVVYWIVAVVALVKLLTMAIGTAEAAK